MKEISREKFLLKNMGLVDMVAHKYKKGIYNHPSIDFDDLRQIGVIGLIKAYDRFNPDYGTQFSTYAVHTIKGEITRFLRDNYDSIRFTRHVKLDLQQIINAELLDEEPEIIAEKLGMSLYQVENALDYYANRFTTSLEVEIHGDQREPVLLKHAIGCEIDFDTQLAFKIFLDTLDERTKKIVSLRLLGYTQTEIGKILKMKQAQISRELIRLKPKMKEALGIKETA